MTVNEHLLRMLSLLKSKLQSWTVSLSICLLDSQTFIFLPALGPGGGPGWGRGLHGAWFTRGVACRLSEQERIWKRKKKQETGRRV